MTTTKVESLWVSGDNSGRRTREMFKGEKSKGIKKESAKGSAEGRKPKEGRQVFCGASVCCLKGWSEPYSLLLTLPQRDSNSQGYGISVQNSLDALCHFQDDFTESQHCNISQSQSCFGTRVRKCSPRMRKTLLRFSLVHGNVFFPWITYHVLIHLII